MSVSLEKIKKVEEEKNKAEAEAKAKALEYFNLKAEFNKAEVNKVLDMVVKSGVSVSLLVNAFVEKKLIEKIPVISPIYLISFDTGRKTKKNQAVMFRWYDGKVLLKDKADAVAFCKKDWTEIEKAITDEGKKKIDVVKKFVSSVNDGTYFKTTKTTTENK